MKFFLICCLLGFVAVGLAQDFKAEVDAQVDTETTAGGVGDVDATIGINGNEEGEQGVVGEVGVEGEVGEEGDQGEAAEEGGQGEEENNGQNNDDDNANIDDGAVETTTTARPDKKRPGHSHCGGKRGHGHGRGKGIKQRGGPRRGNGPRGQRRGPIFNALSRVQTNQRAGGRRALAKIQANQRINGRSGQQGGRRGIAVAASSRTQINTRIGDRQRQQGGLRGARVA